MEHVIFKADIILGSNKEDIYTGTELIDKKFKELDIHMGTIEAGWTQSKFNPFSKKKYIMQINCMCENIEQIKQLESYIKQALMREITKQNSIKKVDKKIKDNLEKLITS